MSAGRAAAGICLIAAVAVASLNGCSRIPKEDGPLTFGSDENEVCVSNRPGREVFVAQIAHNDSRAPIKIVAIRIDGATGVDAVEQVIVPIIDNAGLYVLRIPSKDPKWRQRVRVEDSGITTDDRVNLGVIVRRTEKTSPGRIQRIIIEYTWNDKNYIARGTTAYVIPDKCEGL